MNSITLSLKDKVQDMSFNQLKLDLHEIFLKNGKITTNFEPTDDSDVINKGFLAQKLSKRDGHLSSSEKDYNEFKKLTNKQSMEEILIQRAVKTTIQTLYDESFFDSFPNADAVSIDFLFVQRRRPHLVAVTDVIQ